MRFYNYRVKRKRRSHYFSPFNLGGGYQRRRKSRKKSYQKKRKNGWYLTLAKGVAVFLCVLLFLAAAAGAAVVYLRESGKKSLQQAAVSQAPSLGQEEDVSGLVSRNGKKYSYNEDCINILCMGIDRTEALTAETETQEAEDRTAVGAAGQADTILVLSLNIKEGTMKILGISRDTMTPIRVYDAQGRYIGKKTNHLGLAYSYGDGGEQSGQTMMEAVSGLLYNLPLHGYAAVNLNAIEKLNDSVGGVTVTLTDEMLLGGTAYPAGTKITLNGNQAESYVRYRDMDAENSNTMRMERQKKYALSFMDSAVKTIRSTPTIVAKLYQDLTADMSTSIGLDEAVYLGSSLPGLEFSAEDIRTLQGSVKQGAVYEEFYPDEEALVDTVLELFYSEV